MAHEHIDVLPHGDGWTYQVHGGEPQGQFESASQAEDAAKEEARKQGGLRVIVHDREGTATDAETLDEATQHGLG